MYTKYLSLDLSNAKSKENPFGMMMVLHALSSDVVGVYWFQYSKGHPKTTLTSKEEGGKEPSNVNDIT